MSKKPTIFICIEGIDGAGKNLQSNLLRDHLAGMGHSALLIDFPQYDSFFGKEIGAYLSSKGPVDANAVDIKSMSLWYAIDRWKTLSEIDTGQYEYIIFNRYTISNAVYQASRIPESARAEYVDWLFELEYSQLSLPVPDICIFLDVPSKIGAELNNQKGERCYLDGKKDVYENNMTMQESVRNLYLQMTSTMDNIITINCVRNDKLLPPMEILNKILYELKI
ncbi:MAG: hypothetical protein FWC77_03325 [Defluviitaleaceae bacterium]|nr:hypothetical protein [Defluviitaleaceae bacterium]